MDQPKALLNLKSAESETLGHAILQPDFLSISFAQSSLQGDVSFATYFFSKTSLASICTILGLRSIEPRRRITAITVGGENSPLQL